MKTLLIAFVAILSLSFCGQHDHKIHTSSDLGGSIVDTLKERVIKTDEEWRKELSPEEYYILREKGTERSFTGDLLDNKESGVYTCAGCNLPLFSSDTKFNSGTGWPSFYQPISDSCITEIPDYKYGWNRVEVVCSRCGGHQGHVFEDGPNPTGLRYCINSVALDFESK